LPEAASLQACRRSIGGLGAACRGVRQATPGIVDQQQMDALALEVVVVVQPIRVDDCDVALAV